MSGLPVYDPSKGDPAVIINAAAWTMVVISGTFLGLRIYSRAILVKHLWWDDYLLVVGWIFTIATSAVLSEMARRDFGKTILMDSTVLDLIIVADNLHKFALAFTKTSFSLTLLRLIKTGWQRWLIIFLIGSFNIYLIFHLFYAWRPVCGGK